jgi:hypothetical protein
MGLDMYAEKVKAGSISEPVDFTLPEGTQGEELHYWRKHPNLHGWMEQLYREKGGQDPNFNCNTVQITDEDLDRLEKDINGDELPETHGFFFGSSQPEDKADDIQFISSARRAIKDGFDVYYTSWW